jgi:hypothetical protein
VDLLCESGNLLDLLERESGNYWDCIFCHEEVLFFFSGLVFFVRVGDCWRGRRNWCWYGFQAVLTVHGSGA